MSFLVSWTGTIIRRSTIPVAQQLLDMQGISPYILFHLDLTSRGFTYISLHLHLNPPRVTEITSLEWPSHPWSVGPILRWHWVYCPLFPLYWLHRDFPNLQLVRKKSQNIRMGSSYSICISFNVCFIHRTCVQHVVAAIYSSLTVDNDTDDCFFLSQDTKHSPK